MNQRLDFIAEGLALLSEHVSALRSDASKLADSGRTRGFAVLTAQANEEAAKALILLDLVRMGFGDSAACSRQIRHFYNHLARCLYVEAAQMRPATFYELRSATEAMRPSLHLDGPNDVDWIFRNQLLTQREETLYVDVIHDDDGDRWVTPARFDGFLFSSNTPVLDLIIALKRTGCMSRPGLEVITTLWHGRRIEDDTHWKEVEALNRQVLDDLNEKGLFEQDTSAEDVRVVLETWTFPLGQLDLREVNVDRAELEARQERWSPYDA